MRSKKLAFVFEAVRFKKMMRALRQKQARLFFFFPYCGMGGAERVHADILQIFTEYHPLCFLSVRNSDQHFRSEFERSSNLIDLSIFLSLPYAFYRKQLANLINQSPNAVVFGSNSNFFYQLIPYLHPHVRVIDLIHAFQPDNAYSPEQISLPVAERINQRIVLGKKTLQDFVQLYCQHGKSSNLAGRIHIIPNKIVPPPLLPIKPNNTRLQILFVGRNAPEKRPKLFLDIAAYCLKKNIAADFHLIGDFPNSMSVSNNVHIIGSITDQNNLNQYYQNADLILITSWREGLPMVMLEAMAYGVVPISTNVGEINSVINDSNGILIEDATIELYQQSRSNTAEQQLLPCIESFATQIAALNSDRGRLAVMSKNAYCTVSEKFSAQANREAYLNLFFSTD